MRERPVQLDDMMTGFTKEPVATLQQFSYSIVLGILGWAIVWPILTLVCYLPFLFALKRAMPGAAAAKGKDKAAYGNYELVNG